VALVAKWHGFWSQTDTDNKRAAGSFHDFVGDDGQLTAMAIPSRVRSPHHLAIKAIAMRGWGEGDAAAETRICAGLP
jgi:hypothetical protein